MKMTPEVEDKLMDIVIQKFTTSASKAFLVSRLKGRDLNNAVDFLSCLLAFVALEIGKNNLAILKKDKDTT